MEINYTTENRAFYIKIKCNACKSTNIKFSIGKRVTYMGNYEGSQQEKPCINFQCEDCQMTDNFIIFG
jgi:hypothetical protein